MDEVNERIKKNLDSDEWEKAKPKFDYHFSIDTLEGKSRRRSRPKGGARPDKKKEQSFRSFESKKTVLSFNLLGDALRDRLDPRMKTQM